MSTRRYDLSQRARPLRLTTRGLRREGTRSGFENRVAEWETSRADRSVLSVVVAAKNEAPNLPQLIQEIARALRPLCRRAASGLSGFEVVVVDDGSTDGTQQVLLELSEVYSELRWATLATTTGQSSATVTGILVARGNWIATLDADLQNDPADLVHLWNALPGHDAALGWRTTRQDVVSKRVLSVCANWVRNLVLRQSIRDTGCSVRIFSRARALRLPRFHGMHRFIGPLLLREGCELIQVPVKHRLRASGRTHYNLWNRSLCVLIDLLGVVWLLRRPVRYQVSPQRGPGMTAGISRSESTVLADTYGFLEG
jgi:glycosyltransferase involved in cell wall biosynthesis